MKSSIFFLCVLVILAALVLPKLLAVVGVIGGLFLGLIVALGIILLVVFILGLTVSGIGLLAAGVLGLIGVVLLAIVLPFLAPLFLVLIPIGIIIKLIFR